MRSIAKVVRGSAMCACFLLLTGCLDLGVPGEADTGADDTSAGDGDGDAADTPPSALVTATKQRLERANDILGIGRSLLETLGLLPDYDCSETAVDVSAAIATRLDDVFSCATILAEADGVTTRVVFPANGCQAHGLTFRGEFTARASAGTDRLTVAIDLFDLTVNGKEVSGSGLYDKCGDVSTLAVESSGLLAAGDAYLIDVAIAKAPGLPVVGSTTLTFDGSAERTDNDGTDRLSLFALEYQLGALLPNSGTLIVQTATGHRVEATFSERSFLHGEVRIQIDDYAPITLPLL